MMFPCNQCGQCCRHLKMSPIYADLDRGDGICRFLKGNMCSIYKKRPLKCRIDESYELFFKERMSREQFYALNLEVCRRFQKEQEE